MLIFREENSKSALVSYIFRINPHQNYQMLSSHDIMEEANEIDQFLKANDRYTVEIIKSKRRMCDYDYIDKYKELLKESSQKGLSKVSRYIMYGNAKLIQSKAPKSYRHDYFIKITTDITKLQDDEEIIKKRQLVTNLLTHFPYIQEALSTIEVIQLILIQNRYFSNELIALTKEVLIKEGIIL